MTPYRFYIEIQIPEFEDYECANRNTRVEAEAWAQEAEDRWTGCTATIQERISAGNGCYLKMIIDAEKVKGFEKLNDADASMFKSFLNNFIPAQGTESRRSFVPQKVTAKKDKGNGKYLRFDYLMMGRKCWLHVKSPWTWY